MRLRECALAASIAAMLLAGASPAAAVNRDYAQLTCGNFLASGKDNMAVLLWWLRGYHAGKSGEVAFDTADGYPARLGFYCGSHRGENLLENSEHILDELDHGI